MCFCVSVFMCLCVCISSLSGSVWSLRTTFSSCSQTGCLQRSLTGWHPPSLRGFDGLCDAPTRSPSSAALCMQCRLGYLWRGKITHMFYVYTFFFIHFMSISALWYFWQLFNEACLMHQDVWYLCVIMQLQQKRNRTSHTAICFIYET